MPVLYLAPMPDSHASDYDSRPSDSSGGGLDFWRAATIARRHALLILGCGIIAAGAMLAYSLLQTKQYTAQASLLFRDPGFDQRVFGVPSFQVTNDPAREAETNVRLVSLAVVAARTARRLDHGLATAAVRSRISVDNKGNSDVIAVSATDHDPKFAARLANAFAETYISFRRGADRAKIAQARALVQQDFGHLGAAEQQSKEGQALREQISNLATLQALQTGNAELVQHADVPTSASSPKTTRNTVLFLILGLGAGFLVAIFRERHDRRLRNADEFTQSFELPILGLVPESDALEISESGAPQELPFAEREAFRLIRTRLRYFNIDREIKSVLVTSPSPSDGKTTVAWNLALTAASAGLKTLIIEADFHRASFAQRGGLAPIPGLSELLSRQTPLDQVRQQATIAPRGEKGDEHDGDNGSSRGETRFLDVIVAGASPPNPTELMESKEMAKLLEELRAEYDLVVIDTPPIAVLAEAIPLMKLVDGVIAVGRFGKTTRDDAIELSDHLKRLGAPTLGVVANRARKGRRYGYGYGYGYYGSEGERSGPTGLRVGGRSS
jgi:Mrp family chromosome partitioning ATPase